MTLLPAPGSGMFSPEARLAAGVTPGATIGGYVVERRLGAGGMGVVWLARHARLGSRHALKFLLPEAPARLDERLRQEGRIQALLDHPNVVRVTDTVEVDGRAGLVLEYVDGATLATLLSVRTLSIPEVDAIGRGVLAGAAAAHTRGWIHRDLKPGNVLLAAVDGRLVPKIADFGIAAIRDGDEAPFEAGTTTRRGLGTRRYMSLEQLTGHAPDARMDVFALGAVLFETCTGAPAFPTVEAWEDAIRAGVAPEPVRDGLPERMRRAIRAALGPRDVRPADAGALLRIWEGEGEPRVSRRTLVAGGLALAGVGALGLSRARRLASLGEPARWTLFDVRTLVPEAGTGFLATGVVVGPYLYAPGLEWVLRHDTRLPLDAPEAWSRIEVGAVTGSPDGAFGVATDGRTIWFGPCRRSVGHVLRHDPRGAFDDPRAWATFDLGRLGVSLRPTLGVDASLDALAFAAGRLFLAPSDDRPALCHDPSGAFHDPGGWTPFDVARAGVADGTATLGATFDGRWLYLAPHFAPPTGVWSGEALRFDTTGAFSDPAAWERFDLGRVLPGAGGYSGATFDGRHVYLAPYHDQARGWNGRALRFDTRAAFAEPTSWESFDLETLAANARGYTAAVRAGRGIYYAPFDGQWSGVVARFDAAGGFGDRDAWETFDLATLDPAAVAFGGAVALGDRVMFLPYHGTRRNPGDDRALVAVFDAGGWA